MMQGKQSKTERVKQGRKFVQRKVDVWTATDDFVTRVIALASLGDKDARSAINHYLSINENGLVEYRGFRHLMFETTLASREMQQELIPLIKKALLNLKPHASKRGKNTEERKYRQAHIALLQMGDKTGFDHVMEVIGGHDRKVIMDVLDHLGGRLAPTSTGKGAQRIRVGKGGLSVKDATRLQDLIRKRMSFWPDRKTKEYAVRVIMELSGAIKAAS